MAERCSEQSSSGSGALYEESWDAKRMLELADASEASETTGNGASSFGGEEED